MSCQSQDAINAYQTFGSPSAMDHERADVETCWNLLALLRLIKESQPRVVAPLSPSTLSEKSVDTSKHYGQRLDLLPDGRHADRSFYNHPSA